MKKNLCFLFFLLLILTSCQSGKPTEQASEEQKESQSENKPVKNYGADEYGMKTYVMAFLKKGPDRSHDSLTAARIQRAHLDNITRLSDSGLLVLAGPFLDNSEIRGIYIFNVGTIQEAERLTASDPAIQSGRLTMELHPWYGSAALIDLSEHHKKIAKKSI